MEDPEGEKATLTLSHSPTEQSVDEKHPSDSSVPKVDEVAGIPPQEEAAGRSPAVGVQFQSSNPMEGEEADVPESADTSDELHIPTYSEVKSVPVFDALCTEPESNQLNSPSECSEDPVCLHSFPLPESEQVPIFDTMEAGEEPHKMSTEEVEVLAYETSSVGVQHNYRMFEEVGEVLGSRNTSLPKKDMEASSGLAEVGDELIDGDSEEVKADPDITRALGNDGISDYEIEIAGDLVEAAVKEFAEEAVESAGDDMEAACSGDIASENEFSMSVDMKKGGRGRKRGRRSSKLEGAKFPSQKKDEEEVCFICFDGGDLVVCDRRGCPKVYHPSCVNRKEAYFQSKGQWSCGWHLCSKCQKSACYKCYTCTYSLCKSCVNVDEFTCIRGNKGFCAACLTTILLMETSENANEKKDGVDFNDRSCWEYLFKDYWYELKQKLLMNLDELTKDRTASKVSDLGSGDEVSSDNAQDASSDRSSACHDGSISSKKKLKLTKPNARKILRKADQTDGFSTRDDNSFRKRTKSRFRNPTPDSLKKERKVESSCQENSLMIKEKKRPRKNTSKVGTVIDTESELSVHKNNSSRTKSKSKSRKPVEENKLADACEEQTTVVECTDWASKELLEFISHVKNGDKSILSLYDVQELLLDYVKVNKLRDPRKKSQIICDSMLLTLFDKTRVGHFEMLKLLESHFLIKVSSPCSDENQGGDTSLIELGSELINDLEGMMNTSKQQISRKRVESKSQTNLYSYAAVDVHNINLMYLRRSLMEELIDDMSTFSEKVIGSFVRIRVTFSSQKQEVYRLVQVVGCGKATEEYKTGKRTTDVMLEIINLDKKEIITVDIISNQEFTEEECKRLRQSIKFGFISRLTVGEVQEKARVLQSVRINDNLESEKLRFTHLRDRASEKGRKKEHRECVEKLHLLCSPEEHMKRLNEVAQAHADPKMDPDYESPEDDGDDEIKEGYPDRPMQTLKEDVGHPDRPMPTFKERELNVPGKEGSSCNWSGVAKCLNSAIVSPPKNFEHNIHVETKEIEAKVEALLDDKEPATESAVLPEPKLEASSAKVVSQPNASESEKIWHYKDPSGKIQGPFSVVQLRKWSKHFPSNLSIWKKSERQEDSILLTDALVGNFQKDLPEWVPMNSVHLSSPAPPISSCKLQENTTSLQNDKAAGGAACIDSIRNLDNKHNTWSNDFCKISRNEQIVAHVVNSESTQQASHQPIDVRNRPLIISSDLDPRKKFFEEPVLIRGTGDTIQKHDLAGSDRCFDHGIKAKTEKVIDHSASSTESNTVPEVSQCDNTCTSLQKVGTSDARPIVESNVLVSASQISDVYAFSKPGPETSKSAYASTSIQNAGTFANSASGHLPTYMVPQTIVSCNWNQPTANLGEQSAPTLNSTTMLSGINVGVSTSVNCQTTPLLSSDGTKPFISPQLNNSASTVTYQPPNMSGWGAVTTEINNPGWQIQTQYQNQSNMAAAVGNLLCGAGVQGGLVNNNNSTNVGWGMMAQGNNMNTSWVVAPNVNTAWNQGLTLPPQGNAPFIGPPQGNVAPYQMWSAPVQMNSSQNHVRPPPVVAKTNPITHANNAATKENPSSSNVQSERSSDRNFGLGDSGFRGGRPGYGPGRQSRNWMTSGNVERSSRPQEHTGICSYHMQGHCKKGSSCNYIHS